MPKIPVRGYHRRSYHRRDGTPVRSADIDPYEKWAKGYPRISHMKYQRPTTNQNQQLRDYRSKSIIPPIRKSLEIAKPIVVYLGPQVEIPYVAGCAALSGLDNVRRNPGAEPEYQFAAGAIKSVAGYYSDKLAGGAIDRLSYDFVMSSGSELSKRGVFSSLSKKMFGDENKSAELMELYEEAAGTLLKRGFSEFYGRQK